MGTSELTLTDVTFRSTGADSSLVAEVDAEGNSGATVFLLSRLLFAGFGSGLLTGVEATGAGVVVAAPGWTILTMFSSR